MSFSQCNVTSDDEAVVMPTEFEGTHSETVAQHR